MPQSNRDRSDSPRDRGERKNANERGQEAHKPQPMNLTIPSRDQYLTGPDPFENWEAPWNEPILCVGIDGATLCDGRTCWNVATHGDMCQECHQFATTNADYINEQTNTTKP